MNLIIITINVYISRSLHIGKTHDQHLEACCIGISFRTILNSYRVIGIATNYTSMVLNCPLVT